MPEGSYPHLDGYRCCTALGNPSVCVFPDAARQYVGVWLYVATARGDLYGCAGPPLGQAWSQDHELPSRSSPDPPTASTFRLSV